MSDDLVLVGRDAAAHTATLTLNRPDKRNALSAGLGERLCAALNGLRADPAVRVVVLRGAGTAFCAGADLDSIRALQSASYAENLADGQRLRGLLLTLAAFPKPTIAAVHGPALAGGAGIASACDFVIATEEASFGYPEVKIGFVAALVMVLLTRQVGERRARDLLLTGQTLGADEARAIGLINEVVPAGTLDERVAALAATLVKNSPEAMARTKELLARVWSGDFTENLTRAAEANAQARGTADCREGVAAFLDKRKPRWADGS